MPKASPLRQSFNGGEFSALMEGRTDLDRYPASMRAMLNAIAVPQGPAMRRSGTYWQGAVYDETKRSALIPFVFSEDQSNSLEFANFKMRVHSEAGVQTYTPTAVTNVVAATPMKIRSSGHGAAIGDQVFLSGFPVATNANNRTAMVTAVSGTDITLNFNYNGATGAISGPFVARVYTIDTPYSETDVTKLRYLQSVDVVYIFCDGFPNYKLSRVGSAYGWTLAPVVYKDGPYMPIDITGTKMTLNGTGNPIPNMTSNAGPTGVAASWLNMTTGPGYDFGGFEAWRAFDGDQATYWHTYNNQAGVLEYAFPSAIVVDGYVIYIPVDNADTTYTAVDYAPGTWTLWATNTMTNPAVWEALDAQNGYVLYENNRSVRFKLNNITAYRRYRLEVRNARRNGPIQARVARLVFSSPSTGPIQITASAITGINDGDGFKTTDVGRLIRIKSNLDAMWRPLRIVSRTSPTVVSATLEGEPFIDADAKTQWRLGYWSDTTGWPICGAWFEDRLVLCGPIGTPDLVALSRTGAYEDFQQTTTTDAVLDDNAVVFRINSRKLSRIRWVEADERGLMIGTGSQEFVVTPGDKTTALTARNIRARPSTERGSADMEPAKVDRQVLFTQAAGKTIREHAYVFEQDGYKSPSMSLFASHLGAPKFSQLAYAAEPHSIVWVRRLDGTIVGLTYNREENVIGWHRHDFAGGVVESCCVIPSPVDKSDVLWMVVRRTVNGATRRYVERLTSFWDFDSTLDTAFFVDCGLRVVFGTATSVVNGLWHLEGKTVDALIDGIKCRGKIVTNGQVTFDFAGLNIAVGLPYLTFCETSSIEAGAGDGTAQGKTKRMHNISALIWASIGGQIGKWDEQLREYVYTEIDYPQVYDELEPPELQSTLVGPMPMPLGYGKRGSIAFKQEDPYPYNVVALMPQLHTQDR